MKTAFILPFLFLGFTLFAQSSRINPHALNQEGATTTKTGAAATVQDTTYDVQFYHLDLEIAVDSAYLEGNVGFVLRSEINGLTSLTLDLDSAYTVDSVSAPATGFSFQNNVLTVDFTTPFNQGDLIDFQVYYHGVPQVAGGIKGLRYETHDGNEPIIASLSTPFLAHTWYPCKDGPGDKADSVYVDITIKDTVISSLPMIAVANGVLESVVQNGNTKTFQWRHRYPIVPFYVMVAISNYDHFQQTYTGTGYSFPMDYYVFNSALTASQAGTLQMPDAMDFFTQTFGPYPFRDEKYGMTQLGYFGGIENQTNSIINQMSPAWFYVSVHELAHQWFADLITCEDWHHGWLNEGFASYAEALYEEHASGTAAYHTYMEDFEYYDAGSLYLINVDDPFNVFQGIIYNKGAYVLHMLRGVMGDADFFDAIRTYVAHPFFAYDHATTEDFQAVCETQSGVDLDYFFDQWIYDQRYPWYRYNYEQDSVSGDLEVLIVQTQGNLNWRNLFTMPVQLRIEFTDGSYTTVTVFNDQPSQTFSFPTTREVSNVLLDPNDWILKNVRFDDNLTGTGPSPLEVDFAIYPNPHSGSFSVQLPTVLQDKSVEVRLRSLEGKVHYQTTWEQNHPDILPVEVPELANGIYLLEVVSGEYRQVQKVLKK